jgi:branched-chain amino acid transport system substrate-binding protein
MGTTGKFAPSRRVVALGGLAALASPAIRPSYAQSSTVRIGLIQSMSGSLSAYAQEGQPALEYIVKKINAGGGIKSMGGAKIEMILADDTSQPARTAAEARRLATEEKVSMIVGTILSGQMLALSPVLDELKIPALSIWAGASRSEQLYTLGFPYDRGYAQSMNDMVVWLRDTQGMKLKTVVPAYSNYEAGQQTNKFLIEKLKASGFEIIGDAPLDTKAQDQTAAMIRIRGLKPDLVMGLVTPRDGLLLHQARYNLNYHDSLFVGGTGGYSDLSLWKDMGPEVGKSVLTRNLFGMTGFAPGAKMDSMQVIVKELRDVAKLDRVGQGAIQAAQAVRVVQRALENAGSPDRAKILDGLKRAVIPPGDPDLYIAKPKGLAFGEDRMLTDGSAMFIQWQPDQSQEVVFPSVFAQVKPRPRG